MQSSRSRFRRFLTAYRSGRIRELVTDEAVAAEATEEYRRTGGKSERRRYLAMYAGWLRPHWKTAATLLVLAVVAAAIAMAQPLFVKFLLDDVLLAEGMSSAERLTLLNMVGGLFLTVVVLARATESTRNLLQRLLNVRLVLALRKALFERLLHLPLANLHDMKIGGIISRLSGDIDRTSGLLQLAIISPGVAVIQLLIALGVLLVLNWRLAAVAVVVLPVALGVSMMVARRVRPIYRSMRKENAAIDARASETFGGIRVVRSFQREVREELEFLVRRHTVVRKELFAHRREVLLWTTWGLLIGGANVVIVWLGGWMQIGGNATVGD
ncbi:MAG: ABC transporter ATP-binding protein, partial [Planctomycetota bacterium]